MKNIILFIFLMNFLFSGVWISYDIFSEGQVKVLGNSVSQDYDRGAFVIGGDKMLTDNISIGLSYDIAGAEVDDIAGSDQWLNFYGRYNILLNEDVNLWGSIGVSKAMGDTQDAGLESGISYGIGLSFNGGIGLSYSVFNADGEIYYDGFFYNVDAKVTRAAITYSL